jgi:hypothetical protein
VEKMSFAVNWAIVPIRIDGNTLIASCVVAPEAWSATTAQLNQLPEFADLLDWPAALRRKLASTGGLAISLEPEGGSPIPSAITLDAGASGIWLQLVKPDTIVQPEPPKPPPGGVHALEDPKQIAEAIHRAERAVIAKALGQKTRASGDDEPWKRVQEFKKRLSALQPSRRRGVADGQATLAQILASFGRFPKLATILGLRFDCTFPIGGLVSPGRLRISIAHADVYDRFPWTLVKDWLPQYSRLKTVKPAGIDHFDPIIDMPTRNGIRAEAGTVRHHTFGLYYYDNDKPTKAVTYFTDGTDIDAEDLIRGYAPQVSLIGASGADPRPLCRRAVTMKLPDSTALDLSDEGWVAPGMVSDGNGTWLSPSTLFNWQGWSLAAPNPIKGLSSDGKGPQSDPVTFLTIKAKHLPSLRYGNTYGCLLKPVLLDGTVLDDSPAEVPLQQCSYGRIQPVDPPHLMLPKPPSPGDDVTVIILRRYKDGTSDVSDAFRYAYAPSVAPMTAIQHGALDDTDGAAWAHPDPEQYATLKDHQDPINEIAGGADPRYISDPMATGVVVYRANPSRPPQENKDFAIVDWPGPNKWPDYKACQIQLDDSNDGTVHVIADAVDGIIMVQVPKAQTVDVEVRTAIGLTPERARLFSAVLDYETHLGRPLTKAEVKTLVSTGAILLNPHRKVTLIHAVQSPLFSPDFGPKWPNVTRNAGSSVATMASNGKFPYVSAGELRIEGTWNDWTYDGARWSNAAQSKRLYTEQVPANLPETAQPLSFSYDFGDTRARSLSAWCVAVSRFLTYLEPGKQNPDDTTLRSPIFQVQIPSSAQPPVAAVVGMFPATMPSVELGNDTFVWKAAGGFFEIQLADWYASGDGELLAVCVATDDSLSGIYLDPVEGGTRIPSSSIEFPLELKDKSATINNVVYHLHNVDLAVSGDQFFARVGVRVGNGDLPAYRPFVRLVLARYQPSVIPGVQQVSDQTVVDFMQSFNDRTVTVIYGVDKRAKISVTRAIKAGGTRSSLEVYLQSELYPQSDLWADKTKADPGDAPDTFVIDLAFIDPLSNRLVVREWLTEPGDVANNRPIFIQEIPLADLGIRSSSKK